MSMGRIYIWKYDCIGWLGRCLVVAVVWSVFDYCCCHWSCYRLVVDQEEYRWKILLKDPIPLQSFVVAAVAMTYNTLVVVASHHPLPPPLVVSSS